MDNDKQKITKGHDYALYGLLSAIIGFFIGLGILGGIVGLILWNESKKLGEKSDLLTACKWSSIIVLILSGLAILALIAAFVLSFMAVGAFSLGSLI